MVCLSLEEAVADVGWHLRNGGVSSRSATYISGILAEHGEDTHEVFQEAADQIRDLIAEGIVVDPELTPAQPS